MNSEILGYKIEKAPAETKYFGSEVAYLLVGKKVTYKLVRQFNSPHQMYVVNSNFNICGLKGNYTFTDKTGEVHVFNPFQIGA